MEKVPFDFPPNFIHGAEPAGELATKTTIVRKQQTVRTFLSISKNTMHLSALTWYFLYPTYNPQKHLQERL